jgi:hypothetical protein
MDYMSYTWFINFILIGTFFAGCVPVFIPIPEQKPQTTTFASSKPKHRWKHHAPFKIPPGHLPPPGQCRIWYPGNPSGQQPPCAKCSKLSRVVPAGAYLISRTRKEPEILQVTHFEYGVEIGVKYFHASTGRFIAEERYR